MFFRSKPATKPNCGAKETIQACVILLAATSLRGQALTPAWVELAENGKAIARIVVNAPQDCPAVQIDGAALPMSLRRPTPDGFRPACEVSLPSGAKLASVGGRPLALPRPEPARIIVFGDTGCRIKGTAVQDCNDPAKWPFLRVAGHAAAAKPDLVIHVGDYLYREDQCPHEKEAFCGGTPVGDRWEAWDADFFTPAAKLLAAAPWAFARGNHETCDRSWRGWFYYLDPHPWEGTRVCVNFQPPYLIRLGSLELAMFDSSAVGNNLSKQKIEHYAVEFASLHARHAWLVVHHPIWGFRTSGDGSSLSPASIGLQKAWLKAAPQAIDLVVSGHVHLFELLSFDKDLPPALIAGQGGTELANPIRTPLVGMSMGNAKVVSGASEHRFGYTILTRATDGWNLTLTSPEDRLLADCSIRGRETSCRNPAR
jgi:hypothetical protein